MTAYVPSTIEPSKKLGFAFKRAVELRHALTSNASEEKIQLAAERVRAAELALLKAQESLLRYQRESDVKAHRLANIAKDKGKWLAMSIEDIIKRNRRWSAK